MTKEQPWPGHLVCHSCFDLSSFYIKVITSLSIITSHCLSWRPGGYSIWIIKVGIKYQRPSTNHFWASYIRCIEYNIRLLYIKQNYSDNLKSPLYTFSKSMERVNLIPPNSKCKRFYKNILLLSNSCNLLLSIPWFIKHINIFIIYKLTSPRYRDQLIFTSFAIEKSQSTKPIYPLLWLWEIWEWIIFLERFVIGSCLHPISCCQREAQLRHAPVLATLLLYHTADGQIILQLFKNHSWFSFLSRIPRWYERISRSRLKKWGGGSAKQKNHIAFAHINWQIWGENHAFF